MFRPRAMLEDALHCVEEAQVWAEKAEKRMAGIGPELTFMAEVPLLDAKTRLRQAVERLERATGDRDPKRTP